MKNVTISFLGLGYKNINQAKIYIYSLNGSLIFSGETSNSKIKVSLKSKCFYKIISESNNEIIKNVIYVNQENIVLAFKRSLFIPKLNHGNSITLLLTDYNYPNLPIKKGTMIFG